MPNYQLSKIYKIVPLNAEDDADIYIGSTKKNTLAERMSGHRNEYRRWLKGTKGKLSSFELFEKYGLQNCFIYLVENYPCNTKDELRSREGHYIKTTPCINKRIECRTDKEYYQDNKAKIDEKNKQYFQDNKVKCNEYFKQYRQNNKENIKKYHRDNKEKLCEYQKQYRLDNKETINLKQNEKFNCVICSGKYTKYKESKHFKSIKHLKALNQIDTIDL